MNFAAANSFFSILFLVLFCSKVLMRVHESKCMTDSLSLSHFFSLLVFISLLFPVRFFSSSQFALSLSVYSHSHYYIWLFSVNRFFTISTSLSLFFLFDSGIMSFFFSSCVDILLRVLLLFLLYPPLSLSFFFLNLKF